MTQTNVPKTPQQPSLLPGDPKGVVTKTTTDKIQKEIIGNISNLSMLVSTMKVVEHNLKPLVRFDPTNSALVALKKHQVNEALGVFAVSSEMALSKILFVWVCQYIPKGTPMQVVFDMVDFAHAQLQQRHPKLLKNN
jgi:hypothetical protein